MIDKKTGVKGLILEDDQCYDRNTLINDKISVIASRENEELCQFNFKDAVQEL